MNGPNLMRSSSPNPTLLRRWSQWFLPAATLSLLLYLYGFHGNAEMADVQGSSALLWMIRRWSGVAGDLSHGWLIPIVSGLALWRRRRDLRAVVRDPSRFGLTLVVLSLLFYLAGVRIQQTRIVLFSLIGLLWSIPFYLYGPRVARLLLFPCAYLVFCIPLSFLDVFTVPLRILGAAAAGSILNGFGMVAHHSGTAITIVTANGATIPLDVADPCSGLRYLLAMVAVTVAYGYFLQPVYWKQWILFLAAAPLAVLGNITRIVAIATVARWLGPEAAQGLYHDYSGYVVFGVAILLMLGLDHLLNIPWRDRIVAWKQPPSPPH